MLALAKQSQAMQGKMGQIDDLCSGICTFKSNVEKVLAGREEGTLSYDFQ